MFWPVVAIIRFYHSTHLRLFYTIRVATCLMRSGHHQVLSFDSLKIILYNSRGDVCDEEISSSNTPPCELYRIILSESNDKT